MAVTIYHNNDCGTSRNALAVAVHCGIIPRIVEYLKSPPSRDELRDILAKGRMSPQRIIRKKEPLYAELGLGNASDDTLFDAIAAHPILLNRPLVVTESDAALCRPSDVTLDFLPEGPRTDFFKENGVPFLRDRMIDASDPGFLATHRAESFAGDDSHAHNKTLYVYRTLGGDVLGYGGFEIYGTDAYLRSIAVKSYARNRRIGTALVGLLQYRVRRAGGKQVWLLSSTATHFFETLGFERCEFSDAPQAIAERRLNHSTYPLGTVLLKRVLS